MEQSIYKMSNDNLSVSHQMENLRPGMSIAFPIERLKSIRSLASVIGLERGVRLLTRTKRDERLVVVSCVE